MCQTEWIHRNMNYGFVLENVWLCFYVCFFSHKSGMLVSRQKFELNTHTLVTWVTVCWSRHYFLKMPVWHSIKRAYSLCFLHFSRSLLFWKALKITMLTINSNDIVHGLVRQGWTSSQKGIEQFKKEYNYYTGTTNGIKCMTFLSLSFSITALF